MNISKIVIDNKKKKRKKRKNEEKKRKRRRKKKTEIWIRYVRFIVSFRRDKIAEGKVEKKKA